MIHDLPSLQDLIHHLRRIPFLASKNIYRVALHFLTRDQKEIEAFCAALLQAKEKIMRCTVCYNWTQSEDICSICRDDARDKRIICVVETWQDLTAIERAGGYKGMYHVLGGSMCPLEGIGPEDLTIDLLLKRVENTAIDEIIFATNPTPEGEATASFISTKLSEHSLALSKLASGVPTGSSLEYMDRITIAKALSGRRPF